MTSPPTAFISYSHDSEAHKAWVGRLAEDLRKHGIDATYDAWEVGPGDDLTAFMERAVTKNDRVIVVCTPRYVTKANAGEGGVGYEKMIVTAELVRNLGTDKFIPIIRASGGEKQVPIFLGARLYVDFDDDAEYQSKLTVLLRELHNEPVIKKPPIGTNPFLHRTDNPPAAAASVALDKAWIEGERKAARAELDKLGMPGWFEITFALGGDKVAATPPQLLSAAKQATIHTFGWPIGVVLENREEFKPRPRQGGIAAKISSQDRKSFDYWSLRGNGDFYLLKSLFEDNRGEGRLFFDTRIVRTTEALLYCRRLYARLGVPDTAYVDFNTEYGGLRGRILASASPRRMLFEGRQTDEDAIHARARFRLSDVDQDPVSIIKALVSPLFVVFDFFELSDVVYADIVNKFINGQID